MSKKPIIVFEGIEGSGKTFHIKNVAKFLKKQNKFHKIKRTRRINKFRKN